MKYYLEKFRVNSEQFERNIVYEVKPAEIQEKK